MLAELFCRLKRQTDSSSIICKKGATHGQSGILPGTTIPSGDHSSSRLRPCRYIINEDVKQRGQKRTALSHSSQQLTAIQVEGSGTTPNLDPDSAALVKCAYKCKASASDPKPGWFCKECVECDWSSMVVSNFVWYLIAFFNLWDPCNVMWRVQTLVWS